MDTIIQAAPKLVDQEARDRFAGEIDVNFSVIAPAGVGKTTAIVQRIVSIANSCDYSVLPSKLSKLVVVTYTQKAADEMRLRSYQALLKSNASPQCLQEFNKAFFGTIHSFCLKIIQSYGPQIGVPSNPTLLTDDGDLWYEFLNKEDSFSNLIPERVKDELCKHVNLGKLSQLARQVKPGLKINFDLGACPRVHLGSVLSYAPKKPSQKVLELQKELKNWWAEYGDNPFALELPEVMQGDSEFKELCAESFAPLWHWLGEASLNFVVGLAQKYQEFRIKKGYINYDDMIGLAAMLLEDSYVASAVGALDYHVILDEAQDTDSEQFSVLLGVARSQESNNPGPGRFCMLGDPQQAIYSSRADLPTYLKVHEDLLTLKVLDTLTFNVTMRCDREIVAHCNRVFPSILRHKTAVSQTEFVPLNPRPWAEEGVVGKIQIDLPKDFASKLSTADLEKHEASVLASKIKELGHLGLGITDWSEVAVIAPRKSWLAPIAGAFEALGIPVQIHSRDDIKGDNPAIAWLTALCTVMTAPNDSFELVGVLREIFGISDDEIACFIRYWDSDKANRHPLNLSETQTISSNNGINQALKLLQEVRKESLQLSLSQAVINIIKKIGLKNRLGSLPGYDMKTLLDSIERVLIEATLAEERGLSLAEFTEILKRNYNTPDEAEAELKGHVQFYTSHMAKGLEWRVVIVPFLFRSILFPAQEYPQMISIGSEHATKIAVTDHPDKKEFGVLLDQYRVAELERLLYVTATRTRNMLLWVDDESLFANPRNAFASLLKITHGGINRPCWDGLRAELSIDSSPRAHVKLVSEEVNNLFAEERERPSFDVGVMTRARKRSNSFLRSIAPSRINNTELLARTLPIEQKSYSPIEYGNWWHRLMETLPWNSGRIDWVGHFQESLVGCPEPSRGEVEFQLFLKSTLIEQFSGPRFIIQTELPFLFKGEQDKCYEGVIDFVAYDLEIGESLIIDWKTDLFNIDDDSLGILKERYIDQLSIYKEVIYKLNDKNTKVYIYSTPLGEIVNC